MTTESEQRAGRTAANGVVIAIAALVAITFVLSIASIPAGLYTIFYTTLSPGLGADTLVRLVLWLGPLPLVIPVPLAVGGVFVFVTAVYLLLFAVAAASKPNPFAATSEGLRQGVSALLSNNLVVAIISIGFLSFTATAINSIVLGLGVPVGTLSGNPLMVFLSASTAPLIEQLGFRVGIIGVVALMLSLGKPWGTALKSLWRPAGAYEADEVASDKAAVVWVAVALGALAFGLAHVSSGAGWDLGKLPEATYGGLVLGYVYVKYGLHVAVLTHWGIDYLGSVFAFFGQGVYGIPWTADPGYILEQLVTYYLLLGIGVASFLLVVYLGVRKVLRMRIEGSAQ